MAECNVNVQDFVRAGRTGRRNALPDITSAQYTQVSTAGLSEVLESFSINSYPRQTTVQSGNISDQQQSLTQGPPT